MKNNYILLTSMYRYTNQIFIEGTPRSALEEQYLSFHPQPEIQTVSYVKKSLAENYGIHDAESLHTTLQALMQCNWWDGPVFAVLMDLYLKNPQSFEQLTPEQLEPVLIDSALQKYTQVYACVQRIADSVPDEETYYGKLRACILDYFQPQAQNALQQLRIFFEEHAAWLACTQGRSICGFNYSRLIDILADASICGYLPEKEADEAITLYGKTAQALFPDWQTFFMSCILGKSLLVPQGSATIAAPEDYIKGCLYLAAAPTKLLELSPIWSTDSLDNFIALLKERYDFDKRLTAEDDPATHLFNSVVYPLFEQYNLTGLLAANREENTLYMLPTDPAREETMSFNKAAELEIMGKQPDEIPLFLANDCLITDKSIKRSVKKLFRKEYFESISWQDSLTFTCKTGFTCDLILSLNGKKLLEFSPNLQRLGMNIDQLSEMFGKELQALVQPDEENLVKIFNTLKERFS